MGWVITEKTPKSPVFFSFFSLFLFLKLVAEYVCNVRDGTFRASLKVENHIEMILFFHSSCFALFLKTL